jgi:predicted TIM-barrel fold metal-dependent hydrolase
MRPHPNLFCDLAAYQHVIRAEDDYPYDRALRIVREMVEALGAERVLWGTDFPYLGQKPYPELIRAIREAPFLKAGESDQILGDNAWRIFSGRGA